MTLPKLADAGLYVRSATPRKDWTFRTVVLLLALSNAFSLQVGYEIGHAAGLRECQGSAGATARTAAAAWAAYIETAEAADAERDALAQRCVAAETFVNDFRDRWDRRLALTLAFQDEICAGLGTARLPLPVTTDAVFAQLKDLGAATRVAFGLPVVD